MEGRDLAKKDKIEDSDDDVTKDGITTADTEEDKKQDPVSLLSRKLLVRTRLGLAFLLEVSSS